MFRRSSPVRRLGRDLLLIGLREAEEIQARFPKVQRRVGGYNLDAVVPGRNDLNLAHILVGSEGTLAFSTAVELKLWPVLGRRAVGACHFGSFHEAMDAAQHLVKLAPIAVELVDRTMIALARDIAMFRPVLDAFVRGEPEAVLLVEFGEDDADGERAPAEPAARAGGRSRLRLGEQRAEVGRRRRRARPEAAGGDRRPAPIRPQHHDVDEGRRESRSRSSRTVRSRWSTWRTTPGA